MAGTWQSRLQVWGLGAVLIVAPLVVWKGVSDMALLPPYLAWTAAMIGLLLVVPGKGEAPAGGALQMPGYYLPLAAFVGWAGISCLWARNPWEGAFEWCKLFVLLAWVTTLLQLRGRMELFTWVIPRMVVVMTGAALGYGYLQLVQVGMETGSLSHLATYQVVSFFAHRNLFAEILLVALPLAGWLLLHEKGWWRWLGGAVAFLTVVMLVTLQVRSTWLGLGVEGLAGLLGLWVVVRRSPQRSRWVRKGLVALVLGLVAAGIGFLAYRAMPGASNLLLVGKSISATHYGSTQERLVLWKKTLDLIQDRPVTGYGLGSWRVELPRMGYADMRMDMQVGKAMFVRTHNDYLQVASETGIVGGLLWAGMLVMAVGLSVRRWFRPEAGTASLLPVVTATGLLGYAVASFFSFPMERVSSLILLGAYLGLAAVPAAGKGGWRVPARAWLRTALAGTGIGLLLAGGLLGLARVAADRHLRQALVYRSQGNWLAMQQELAAGDLGFCSLDPTAAPMRWYAGSAKFQLGDIPGALEDFQAAFAANPHHLHVLNNLGAAWVQSGRLDSGEVYFQRALQLSPVFSEARVNLAATYFNQGKLDLAQTTLLELPDTLADPLVPVVAQGIVRATVAALSPQVQEHPLQLKLTAIGNVPDWCLMALHKAADNGRKLGQQLILEAIYALEKQENVFTLQEAEVLRKKYASIH